MRVHYFQHVAFEGLGSMAPWLQAAGGTVTATRFYESAILPRLEDVDWLIVMGGPMSVNDEAELPWLVAEKQFIRQAIEAGKRVLGVCLGAQLIANVMGARVYANAVREIGWFPVHGVAAPGNDTFRFPASLEAFHWHGETFDLPAGAVHLARSEACEHQAFQLGRSVIGLQFHLETTPASARELVAHGRDELVPAPFVQSEAQILGTPLQHYAAINDLMGDVLSYLRAAGD